MLRETAEANQTNANRNNVSTGTFPPHAQTTQNTPPLPPHHCRCSGNNRGGHGGPSVRPQAAGMRVHRAIAGSGVDLTRSAESAGKQHRRVTVRASGRRAPAGIERDPSTERVGLRAAVRTSTQRDKKAFQRTHADILQILDTSLRLNPRSVASILNNIPSLPLRQ